jgi:hypothetical protein
MLGLLQARCIHALALLVSLVAARQQSCASVCMPAFGHLRLPSGRWLASSADGKRLTSSAKPSDKFELRSYHLRLHGRHQKPCASVQTRGAAPTGECTRARPCFVECEARTAPLQALQIDRLAVTEVRIRTATGHWLYETSRGELLVARARRAVFGQCPACNCTQRSCAQQAGRKAAPTVLQIAGLAAACNCSTDVPTETVTAPPPLTKTPFDVPVLVISLASRQDRFRALAAALAKLGALNVVRVDALDGRVTPCRHVFNAGHSSSPAHCPRPAARLTLRSLTVRGRSPKGVDVEGAEAVDRLARLMREPAVPAFKQDAGTLLSGAAITMDRSKWHPPSAVELATTLSHFRALRAASAELRRARGSEVLILEDDADLSLVPCWSRFLDTLRSYASRLSGSWEFVQLGSVDRIAFRVAADSPAERPLFVRRRAHHWGAAATLWHDRGLSRLLERHPDTARGVLTVAGLDALHACGVVADSCIYTPHVPVASEVPAARGGYLAVPPLILAARPRAWQHDSSIQTSQHVATRAHHLDEIATWAQRLWCSPGGAVELLPFHSAPPLPARSVSGTKEARSLQCATTASRGGLYSPLGTPKACVVNMSVSAIPRELCGPCARRGH